MGNLDVSHKFNVIYTTVQAAASHLVNTLDKSISQTQLRPVSVNVTNQEVIDLAERYRCQQHVVGGGETGVIVTESSAS